MTFTVEVIRASDAFLYLPLYLAETHQLFEAVQKDAQWRKQSRLSTNVQFRFSPSTRTGSRPEYPGREGDANALQELKKLLDADTPAFAICDPLAIFDSGIDPLEFMVVGALIKKSPFWLVSSSERPRELTDLKACSKLIIYNDELASGYSLGKLVAEQFGIPNGTSRLEKVDAVGKEIDELVARRRAGDRNAWAVSVDLLGMARAMRLDPELACRPIAPVTKLVDISDFVTTGIVTSRAMFRSQEGLAATLVMLQGLKRAVAMTRISPGTTALLCKQEAQHDAFRPQLRLRDDDPRPPPLTDAESSWLGEHITRDNLFSIDMSISKSDWQGAAKGRWHAQGKRRRRAVDLYDNVVANKPERRMTLSTVTTIAPDFVRQRRAVEVITLVIMASLALALAPFCAEYLSPVCSSGKGPWPRCLWTTPFGREVAISELFFSLSMIIAIGYMLSSESTRRGYHFLVSGNPLASIVISWTLFLASMAVILFTPTDARDARDWAFAAFALFGPLAVDCLRRYVGSNNKKDDE